MDASADKGKGSALIFNGSRAYEAVSGVQIYVFAGPPLQRSEGGGPRALRAGRRANQREALGVRGRDVGRGRLQSSRRRKPGPTGRLRQKLLLERVRSQQPRALAARRLRVLCRAAADFEKSGSRLVRDLQNQLERHKPYALRHVFMARNRRNRNQQLLFVGSEKPRRENRPGYDLRCER